MFTTLPLLLAIGFAFGYVFETQRQVEFAYFQQVFSALSRIVYFSIVVLIFLASFWYIFKGSIAHISEARLMIAAGAVGVGFSAGVWFAEDKGRNSRDTMIFIVFAGVMILASALEYDISIFDRLTKFGAGGVDVELASKSSGGGGGESNNRNQVDAFDDNAARWPGADRLDYAIATLAQLGERLLRDEQFARIFSGVTPGDYRDLFNGNLLRLEPRLPDFEQQYIKLSCHRLRQLASRFDKIQKFRRDEVLLVTEDISNIISDMRKLYFQQFKSGKNISEDVEKDLLAIEQNVQKEDEVANFTLEPPDGKDPCSPYFANAPDILPSWYDFTSEDFLAPAYTALVLSLLEAATGDAEGAVQLLDRKIARQHIQFQAERDDFRRADRVCPGSDGADSEEGNRGIRKRRLNAYRRLALIARLEDTQDGIMDTMRNTTIIAGRIHSLIRFTADFSLAYTSIRPEDAEGFEAFRRKSGDSKMTRCLENSNLGMALNLLSRWSLVRTVAMTNALESAVLEPELLRADPGLEKTLDDYSDYVAAFDVSCVKAHGYPHLSDSVPRHFLRIVGEYWKARADVLRTSDDDVELEVVRTLCVSKTIYGEAKSLFDIARSAALNDTATDVDPDLSDMDLTQSKIHDELDYDNVTQALVRIGRLLKSYPKAEVDRYCAG